MYRVRLPRDGRRRVYLTLRVNPPFGPNTQVQVQVAGDPTWYACEHTMIQGVQVSADVLMRGPDLPADGAADVPVLADSTVRVRLSDAPQFEYAPGYFVALVS